MKTLLRKPFNSFISSKSLRFQIIFSQLALILSIIVGISYFVFQQSTDALTQNLKKYADQIILQLDDKFTLSLKQIDRMTISMIQNAEVKKILKKESMGEEVSFEEKLRINTILYAGSFSADQPVSLRLFGLNGGVYDNIHSSYVPYKRISEMERFPWFDLVNSENGKIIWLGGAVPTFEDKVSSESAIVGIRRVNNEFGEMNGYILISLHRWAITQYLENSYWNDEGSLTLLDSQNQIVYTNTTVTSELMDERIQNYLSQRFSGTFNLTIHNKPYWITIKQSDYTGWKFISFIPLSKINGDLYSVQRSIIMIGIVSLIIAVIYSISLSNILSKPISLLIKGMLKVEKGDLSIQLDLKGNREVEILNLTFNKMVRRLNDLIYRLAEQQIREKDATIRALNSQFQPHFLYNTLNTIYWKCIHSEQEILGQMVVTLSRLLRYSIQSRVHLVTIREDMEQIRNYLFLQQERFGEDLFITLELDPSIEPYLIPRLLLQPLIENSIVHGLEPLFEIKRLTIIGRQKDSDCIEFVIMDNGIGFSQLPHEAQQQNHSEGTGIGLSNIDGRIKTHFGESYGLSIRSIPNQGTTVTICLPMATKEV